MSAIQWFRVINTEDESVPPFGLMRVVGEDEDGAIEIAKPDTAGQTLDILFNGPTAIPAGLAGQGYRAWVASALYDSADGEPVEGETWGASPGVWWLKKDVGGFTILGIEDEGSVASVMVGGASATGVVTGACLAQEGVFIDNGASTIGSMTRNELGIFIQRFIDSLVLTAERRVITFPGGTLLGNAVCVTESSICCDGPGTGGDVDVLTSCCSDLIPETLCLTITSAVPSGLDGTYNLVNADGTNWVSETFTLSGMSLYWSLNCLRFGIDPEDVEWMLFLYCGELDFVFWTAAFDEFTCDPLAISTSGHYDGINGTGACLTSAGVQVAGQTITWAVAEHACGGDTIVTECCPDLALPLTLLCTVSTKSGDCTCLPATINCVWDDAALSGDGGWSGTIGGGCTAGTITLGCIDFGGGAVWYLLYEAGTGSEAIATTTDCDPFTISFPLFPLTGSCGAGAGNASFVFTVP